MDDMNTLTTNKHKKVARKMKKIVSIRWLSVHAPANGVYNEYVVLLET